MRFFNTTGPCNPTDHYRLPATERLADFDPERLLAPKSYIDALTTPAGRAVTVVRA